jgi:lipopolysaccharide export system protein LptA
MSRLKLKAKGDQGVYVATTDTITMTGNVALMRGRDVAEGQVLKLEITNRRTTLDGGDGRTRMMIDPDSENRIEWVNFKRIVKPILSM